MAMSWRRIIFISIGQGLLWGIAPVSMTTTVIGLIGTWLVILGLFGEE